MKRTRMPLDAMYINIGLGPTFSYIRQRAGLSLSDLINNPASDRSRFLVEDIQRVKDLDSFKRFIEAHGPLVFYKRPDGSVNPVIEKERGHFIEGHGLNVFTLSDNGIQEVWEEERTRILKLLSTIKYLFAGAGSPTEGDIEDEEGKDVAQGFKFFQELKKSYGKHLGGLSLNIDVDEKTGRSVLVLSTPVLESAVLLTVHLRNSIGKPYKKCERKGCSIYFSSTVHNKRFCGDECRKNNYEELQRLKKLYRARVDYRFKKGRFGTREVLLITDEINDAESEEELLAIEKRHGLEVMKRGPKREGTKSSSVE